MLNNGLEPHYFPITVQPEVRQSESSQAERIKKVFEKVPFLEGTFDAAEEVVSLKYLAGSERKRKIWQIRTKLSRQREAWAQCRITIEQEIEINPQIGKEDLYFIVHEFAIPYGFTEPQIRTAETFIDAFDEKRRQITDLRTRFTEDYDLVKYLTDVTDPKRIISVELTPYVFILRIDSGTYDQVLAKRSVSKIPNFPKIAIACSTQDGEQIPFIVINEDAKNSEQKAAYDTCLEHELEHVKENIVQSVLFKFDYHSYLRISAELYIYFTNAGDHSEQLQRLKEYLHYHLNYALFRFRSELFALKSEKLGRSYYDIFYNQDGGAYDYLSFLREWSDKAENIQWKAVCQKIVIEEYTTIINNAIEAFWLLQKAGYSAHEVIALFVDVPVQRWPVVAKRILKEKPYNEETFLVSEAARFMGVIRKTICRESSYL